MAPAPLPPSFKPVVCIVDFHHARGPEVEHWFGVSEENPITDWPLLPFMALSDGAHSAEEDYSYFTLRHDLPVPKEETKDDKPEAERASLDGTPAEATAEKEAERPEAGSSSSVRSASPTPTTSSIPPGTPLVSDTPTTPTAQKSTYIPATTLFGIACTRQLDAKLLLEPDAEVTRSTVQKAVVVVCESPVGFFGGVREKLGMVTRAWFAQRDFRDLEVIEKFQESLVVAAERGEEEGDRDQFIGLSLRELVHDFKHQTLVLFKALLLQPKMIFFGTKCERLCLTQFALLSLVPGLMRHLQDAADPALSNYEQRLRRPSSVRTSDRKSLLNFMGMPLQIFGKGSLFGPYTPLQQLDMLADAGTKSYVVGSTNSLLLQQKDRYSDVLINLDEGTINITSPSLRNATYLSAADRRWIDAIVAAVMETWDDNDPSRPKSMGFVGSEDYIRMQFEEYMLSLVSSVKYNIFLQKHANNPNMLLTDIEGDPSTDFGSEWVDAWKRTDNFRLFQKSTDPELFDLVSPKHVMAGGLTMDDVQRRINQQLQELKLDEKAYQTKEALGRTFNVGRGKVSNALGALAKNVETLRERRAASQQAAYSPTATDAPDSRPASIISTTTTHNELSPQSTIDEKRTPLILNTIPSPSPSPGPGAATGPTSPIGPALAEASSRASAYFSSWASWAGEKRKGLKLPGRSTNATSTPLNSPPASRPVSALHSPNPLVFAGAGPGGEVRMRELDGVIMVEKSSEERREEERRLEEEALMLDREIRKAMAEREEKEREEREREEREREERERKKREEAEDKFPSGVEAGKDDTKVAEKEEARPASPKLAAKPPTPEPASTAAVAPATAS